MNLSTRTKFCFKFQDLCSLITKIRFCFKFQDLYLAKEAIKNIINWPEYFLDFLSISRGKFIIFRMKNSLKYLVRAKTWDRGVITRLHLADDYKINQLFFPSDAVVIDIGAHIGIFSVSISNKAKKIFAYEPIQENYEILLKNIELNNLKTKITAFNYAVFDSEDKLKIYYSRINTAGHSTYGNTKNKYIEAPTVSLKEIFDKNNLNKCDLLKIDTEGCEYRILFGLPEEYFTRIKRIYLEHHKINSEKHNYNCKSLKNYLEGNGFRVRETKEILFAEK